jgi:importin subunit beta-1
VLLWRFECFNTDTTPTAQALQPFVPSIFQLLNTIATDANRSEALMRASMGVIG